MEENRKQEEKDFHNLREKDRIALDGREYQEKYSNLKWYSVVRKSRNYSLNWLQKHCKNKKVLDYCCGLGEISLQLAETGAYVYGIDISEESIKTSEKVLKDAGYGNRSKFQVMDAEKTTFADDEFDIIVCHGVLHHLDLNNVYPELSRVLKPDGEIICVEALGCNPVIKWYRNRTPHLRTEWEAAHILTLREVKKAVKYFNRVDIRYFHLFSILAVPFRKTSLFEPILRLLEILDSVILRIPLVQLLAWQMVFILSKQKK